MGKLTTKTNIGEWLDRIDSTRGELIAAAKDGNRVAAAFAMADARVELIASLQDETIRAKLLRMTDPEIAMVELANNPTEEDRIRTCAIAILSGFTPGDDQFAVFGAGKNRDGSSKAGKIYIKEAGFRILFSHLGIVPEVSTEHPEFAAFGTSGKKVWRVGGKAECVHRGQVYSVEFTGESQLGIPGYESDNVAGIAAKARRRLLQALWAKVSPILTGDQIDDDDVPQTTASVQLLTRDPTPAEQFEAARASILSRLSDKAAFDAFDGLWQAIANAETAEHLATAADEIKSAKTLFSERDVAELRRLYKHRADELKA